MSPAGSSATTLARRAWQPTTMHDRRVVDQLAHLQKSILGDPCLESQVQFGSKACLSRLCSLLRGKLWCFSALSVLQQERRTFI